MIYLVALTAPEEPLQVGPRVFWTRACHLFLPRCNGSRFPGTLIFPAPILQGLLGPLFRDRYLETKICEYIDMSTALFIFKILLKYS